MLSKANRRMIRLLKHSWQMIREIEETVRQFDVEWNDDMSVPNLHSENSRDEHVRSKSIKPGPIPGFGIDILILSLNLILAWHTLFSHCITAQHNDTATSRISKAMPFSIALPSRASLSSWLPPTLLTLTLGSALTSTWLLNDDTWNCVFWTLFTLRYIRLVGHIIGYWCYRPSEIQPDPVLSCRDVTVILPTIDPTGPDFEECITSILANRPAVILVVTVGAELRGECQTVLEQLGHEAEHTRIAVTALPEPSKRRQIAHAMPKVDTDITILADDHVFWPSANFIPSVLAPFENANVGVVATKKHVRRTTPGQWTWLSIVNFIACTYLQRHNWELRASNSIDGGVFVVSGRTAAYRTTLLNDEDVLRRFCNERFFFGLFGGGKGLGPDDDNFLTRDAMKKHWLIRFQDTEEATIETTLGEWPKFRRQLLRWARTTFRSNPVMLRDPSFLCRYPWSAFMVYWAGITNFALLWDVFMITALVKSNGTRWAEILLLLG
ncbi:hypothetical protein AK830_g6499 [Neonectria ditissima]|uniref:Glycosyltransferase 2-like domain-containing protein n=1 Tax=Neonectria ditissima TaxID=78410 RepID=A0A0P7BGB6_9HYPO|nr:hypothetical protein AK830_g6499 [Neonectria ditissima]